MTRQTSPTLHRRPVPQVLLDGVAPDIASDIASGFASDTASGAAPSGWVVDVVAGPGAGRRFPLTPAAAVLVGRSPRATVRLGDPAVAWRHVELDPATRCLRPADAGAVLRLDLLDGAGPRRVGPSTDSTDSTEWPDGAHLVLGSTRLALRRSGIQDRAATAPGPDGTLLVNRGPSYRGEPGGAEVVYPSPPRPCPVPPPPWLLIVLPLLIAIPIALWWRQPIFAVLALLSPMLTGGQYLHERRRRRAEDAAARHGYEQECAERDAELAALREREVRRRHHEHPDLALVAATSGAGEAGPGARLWHRRPGTTGWLDVRLGLADLSGDLVTVREGRRRAESLPDVPLSVDLADVRVLGICGPTASRQALLRALLGQLRVWTSPQQTSVLLDDSVLDDCVLDRVMCEPNRDSSFCSVVVLDDVATLRRRPVVAALLAAAARAPAARDPMTRAPHPRTVVIALAPVRQQLPLECGATIELATQAGLPAMLSLDQAVPLPFRPDLPAAGFSVQIASRLAALRDATPPPDRHGLPDRVGLLELIDIDPARIAERWLAGEGVLTSLPMGRDDRGIWRVDLLTDGPHLLVAGTTGAGKSELLTSLVAALTVTSSPARLGLLLVDYKGGAAFGALADLPHVAGVVTDLDGAAAQRVLTSLGAELRRREHEIARGATPSTLPRLVIVVDEFRVLAEEQPELLAGLVRVATVGRGLGVHLVLATQRPAGVVNPQIRANTNLRIALRVRDAADSVEVIEDPAAARITTGQPGRALVRCGGGAVRTVQTGYLDETDRGRWLTAVAAAAGLLGSARTPVPWLPPLPGRVSLLDLAGLDPGGSGSPAVSPLVSSVGSPVVSPDLPYAMADLPEEQRRAVLAWNPIRDGQLAVVGGPGSGRTTVLRALALACASAAAPVHLHVIDATGALAAPGGLPPHLTEAAWAGLGTLVGPADGERGRRLVTLLLEEVADRSAAGGDPGRPAVLLLVDGWESLTESWSQVEHGRGLDDLVRLARQGHGVGVYVAATGGRGLLGGSIAGAFTSRVVLATTDQSVLMLAGLTGRPPAPWPPGRALAVQRGAEPVLAQVIWPADGPPPEEPGTGSGAGPTAVQLLASAGAATDIRPIRLVALPNRVSAGSVPTDAIGVGGDDATPVRFPQETRGALVCGPPGSGRSTALDAICRALTADGAHVVRVGGHDGREVTGPTGVTRTASATGTAGVPGSGSALQSGSVLLLDTGWHTVPGMEDLALGHLTGDLWTGPGDGTGRRLRVVAATSANEALMAIRGLLPALRDERCGLLLGARSAGDGHALGVALPPTGASPPGRGVLVVRGRCQGVQMAVEKS